LLHYQALRVLNAMVDIASDDGQLHNAVGLMRLTQLVIQGRMGYDEASGEDPLLQLPGVKEADAARLRVALVRLHGGGDADGGDSGDGGGGGDGGDGDGGGGGGGGGGGALAMGGLRALAGVPFAKVREALLPHGPELGAFTPLGSVATPPLSPGKGSGKGKGKGGGKGKGKGGKQQRLELDVPAGRLGAIIGTGGETIKQLQASHNVRIDTIGGKNDRGGKGGGGGGGNRRRGRGGGDAAAEAAEEGGVRREAVVLRGAAADVEACRDAITALLQRSDNRGGGGWGDDEDGGGGGGGGGGAEDGASPGGSGSPGGGACDGAQAAAGGAAAGYTREQVSRISLVSERVIAGIYAEKLRPACRELLPPCLVKELAMDGVSLSSLPLQ
jgi:hypothetical protein